MISVQNHLLLLNGNSLNYRNIDISMKKRALAILKSFLWFFFFGMFQFVLFNSPLGAIPSGKNKTVRFSPIPQSSQQNDWKAFGGRQLTFPLNLCDYAIEKDSVLEILLLIPLNSDELTQAASSRFVNYYGGMLMAMSKLQEEGLEIAMTVVDTEEKGVDLAQMKKLIESMSPDLVIGPYKKEDIQELAYLCKNLQIPLVSPWHTSSKITLENPYYIQMKPNLKQHFTMLVKACMQEYGRNEVTVIGLESDDFKTWSDFLQHKAMEDFGVDEYFSMYTVTKDSLMKGPTAFTRFLKKQKPRAVLIPYYSFKDEQVVYQILKRLSSEKGDVPLTVYGMPVIIESDKIEFDQYHLLDMRVVVSDFVDDREAEVRNFRRKYLEKYGEIPTNESVKGYDLMFFLGKNLSGLGRDFASKMQAEPTTFLQSTYQLRETLSDQVVSSPRELQFDFFENKHLDIIEFIDKRWQRRFN
ncbi:MAG: ABC transporter substrate-binding protein [Saprospiraceae bacterium]|jgi:ABC-type branched-subunit amino acid transport system substrate-binding protein|nr:ABC transporter substrate-binding protein [Saprospiraceae bacterium]